MNFSCDSVKPKAKLHNEDFCFDIETPRGHFFAVLDFSSHDYANLNAMLKGKLETIVGSFASLDDFSDDLFLGFLAKEINNFVSNLADQAGGPELLFSAALCLVTGDNLAYFLAGNVGVNILKGGDLIPLKPSTAQAQLGARSLDVPLREGIDRFSLHDDDLVLITTQGLASVLPAAVSGLSELDPKSISDLLMITAAAGGEDRTVVVIGGPYTQRSNATLADSAALAELKTSLALLTARLDKFTESEQSKQPRNNLDHDPAKLEQKLNQEIVTLKDDLGGKAASIDLLELEEKVEVLSVFLASKADTADVVGLQRDVLKLSLTSTPSNSNEATAAADNAVAPAQPPVESSVESLPIPDNPPPAPSAFTFKAALIVLLISALAGLAGGWLHSRLTKRAPEVWSVKASGNQIAISRIDGPNREAVIMTVADPAKTTGEQTFSSFADVKRYVDTITSPSLASQGTQTAPAGETSIPDSVSEITIKPGDSLKRIAQTYNVTPEKIKELNPTVTRWSSIRTGQKIFVPGTVPTATTSLTPQPTPSPVNPSPNPANTTLITVGPGDSLNELARRFNTTAQRLKELNPQMNWPRIQAGQKVIVPTPTPLGG